MQQETKQSFIVSVFVHGGFVALALLFLFLENWLERPEPVVFELVSPAASPQVSQPVDEPTEQAPLDPLEIPETQPIKPLPDVPDLPEPVPEPLPEPKPVEPEPRPQMSYEEWARNRKLPERVQRVQQPRNKPVVTPEIETNVRTRLEEQLSPIIIQGADLSQLESSDELQRYLADLRRRIQAAFQPSGSGLQAETTFVVTTQGRITNARISRSSGVPAFDESALRTLQVARSPGPPPGNQEYTFSLIFRSE